MKQKAAWITVLIVMVTVIICLFTSASDKSGPARAENVPETAVWAGEVDEGFWFDLVNIRADSNKVRFRIYNDYDGKLVLDADFITQGNCQIPQGKNILDSILYFEFKKIVLLNGCELDAKYPAYGGTFWELDTEQM